VEHISKYQRGSVAGFAMRSRQTDGLRTGGHAFDPVTHVCAKCEMTRKQFLDASKPKCAGRPSEAERFLIDGEPDSKGG
jgi:hypothetical protein